MSNEIQQAQAEPPFLTVSDAGNLMRMPIDSVYVLLCDSGKQGGKRRRRFPQHLYIKIGRKVLFIKERLLQWLMNGAQFDD
jgi:hypothetical protein